MDPEAGQCRARPHLGHHAGREWETGRRTPNLALILFYARFAGISTDILLDDALDLPPAGDQD